MLAGPLRDAAKEPHIWWGVSVEDRKYGLPRIADLQAAPAAVRFLSVEPLLEDLGKLTLKGISWVIVGGESGPGARPMKESGFARSVSNARPLRFRSSSSNGAVCGRRWLEERYWVGRMTDFRSGCRTPPCRPRFGSGTFRRLRVAPWCSSEQLSLDFLAPREPYLQLRHEIYDALRELMGALVERLEAGFC